MALDNTSHTRMTRRKYTSEFALSAETQLVLVLQYEELDRLAEFAPVAEFPCHIYLICRRPRITLDPAGFAISAETVRGRFRIQRGPTFEERDFEMVNAMNRHDLRLECAYPHSIFAFVAPNGDKISQGKVGLLAHYVPAMRDVLDLEVLYVGQAFGANGERTAPDRLKGHSTLLGIYAEAASRSPDQEVYLVLLNFNYMLIGSFDGRDKNVAASDQEDRAHIDEVINADLPEQVWINFAEAALIRYFQPSYNVLLRETFPNPAHASYRLCYDVDLNMLAVAIDTSEARTRLWSSAVAANWIHFANYALHSAAERKTILELA